MKFFSRHASLAVLLTCTFVCSLFVVSSVRAQGEKKSPEATPKDPPAYNKSVAPSGVPPAQGERTPRERRAQAYAKLLEGQRYFTRTRGQGITKEHMSLAQQAFKQAAELDPRLAEAHTALAEVAFFMNDLEQSESEAHAAIRIDRDNLGAHRLLSRIDSLKARFHQNNPDIEYAERAITELREVVRLRANDPEAWALLGELYQLMGRDNEAIEAFRRWAAAPPALELRFYQVITQGGELSQDAAAARLGEILLRTGRTAESIAAIRRAITLDPENRRYVELLGLAFANAQRYDEAVAAYEDILKARGIGNTPLATEDEKRIARHFLKQIVELQQQAGRTEAALATVERMRRVLGNDDPAADLGYVELLRAQGKRQEALQAVRAARQRYPNEAGFVNLEAEILADLGQVDQAVALHRARLKGTLEDYNEYLRIASLYIEAGRGREAVEAARKLLELAPPSQEGLLTQALLILSSAQERAGDPKGAEDSLRRILAKDPDNPTALNNLGYFLVERNERLTEALEMIQRAVKADPTNASYLDSLGWAYFKLGKLEDAERYLIEAADRRPTSVTIQEHLGDVYQQRGKMDLARAAWRKALSLSVEAKETARIKAKLSGGTVK